MEGTATPTTDDLSRVKELGTPFAASLLSLPEEHISEFLAGTRRLDSDRLAAISILSKVVAWLKQTRALNGLSDCELSSALQKLKALQTRFSSPTNQSATDPVLVPLLELLSDSYPYFLLPMRAREAAAGSMTLMSYGHPARTRFSEAVLSDNELVKLFPMGSGTLDRKGYIESTHFASTIQLDTLPVDILRTAYAWMRVKDNLSIEAMAAECEQVLEAMRRFARGDTVTVPALFGFEGVALPKGQRVATVLGHLSYLSPGLRDVLPSAIRPPSDGEDLPGFALITTADIKVVVKDQFQDLEQIRKKYSIPAADPFEKALEAVALGVSLAIPREAPSVTSLMGRIILNPFIIGDYSFSPRRVSLNAPTMIEIADLAALAEWCDRIGKTDAKGSKVAISRTLRCLGERDRTDDSFVDAVIALEALFGGRDQVALGLATCVARLEGKSIEDRRKLSKSVKKLYDARSKVVHGGALPKPSDLHDKRNEAVSHLIACLRVLYRDWPELLNLEANDRVKEILLFDRSAVSPEAVESAAHS